MKPSKSIVKYVKTLLKYKRHENIPFNTEKMLVNLWIAFTREERLEANRLLKKF